MLDLLGLGALSEKADRNRRQNRSAAARVRGSGRLGRPLMGVAKACARAPSIIAHVQTQPQRNCTLGSRRTMRDWRAPARTARDARNGPIAVPLRVRSGSARFRRMTEDPSVRLCLFGQSSSTAWICRRPCSSG